MSTSEILAVNGHTTRGIARCIRGIAASTGVWLKTTGNGDQWRPMGPWGSGRTLLQVRTSKRVLRRKEN